MNKKNARNRIIERIKIHGYTYSFDEIMRIYKNYYLKEHYISFTANVIIQECLSEFEILGGKRLE